MPGEERTTTFGFELDVRQLPEAKELLEVLREIDSLTGRLDSGYSSAGGRGPAPKRLQASEMDEPTVAHRAGGQTRRRDEWAATSPASPSVPYAATLPDRFPFMDRFEAVVERLVSSLQGFAQVGERGGSAGPTPTVAGAATAPAMGGAPAPASAGSTRGRF